VNALGLTGLTAGGDVIVAIDGTPVRGADDVVRLVSFGLEPHEVAVFTVIQDGVEKKIPVTLAER
jgi:S1-C subfamily serine protease